MHLPFRLPALTRDDALLFIKQKEQKLLEGMTPEQRTAYGTTLWFSGYEVRRPSSSGEDVVHVLNLSHMLVNSFDAYVPRKLDRAVELFHHVAKVAAERGRPVGVSKGSVDIRIVLALVLIQLFQPELFRCLRRTGTGFDQLRDAFKNGRLSSLASDYELLDWACYGPDLQALAADAEKLKDSIDASDSGVSTEKTEVGQVNHLVKKMADQRLPSSLAATTKIIANLEKSLRHSSQRVRLPIVEKLLEHRAAQRHVFDVLKLFAALQASSAVLPLSEDSVKPYFSWLALNPLTNTSETLPLIEVVAGPAVMPDDSRDVSGRTALEVAGKVSDAVSTTSVSDVVGTQGNRVRISEILPVFNALTSFEPREQAQVVDRAGLQAGQIIDSRSASELRDMAEQWLSESQSNSSLGAFGAKGALLRGLQYLAPYLAPEDAAAFWRLVEHQPWLNLPANGLLPDPPSAALHANVRAALGQDDRFEPDFPFVMTKRFGDHKEFDEPIPGFVRLPAGESVMGHETDKSNSPRMANVVAPFYIARTVTTVTQYASFVDQQGYELDTAIWNDHGVEWLARNKGRRARRGWSEQLAKQSHPVTDITWFEARAYAQWLSLQFRERLNDAKLSGYEVRLPTEAQWERAARAQSLSTAHQDLWPWGDDESTIAQRANVATTGIGEASAVGLFAPNAIGLHDMAGNVLEWMDNTYERSSHKDFPRVLPTQRHESLSQEPLSLRGGSWVARPERASCSFRNRDLPGNSLINFGVRVVLSLA